MTFIVFIVSLSRTGLLKLSKLGKKNILFFLSNLKWCQIGVSRVEIDFNMHFDMKNQRFQYERVHFKLHFDRKICGNGYAISNWL